MKIRLLKQIRGTEISGEVGQEIDMSPGAAAGLVAVRAAEMVVEEPAPIERAVEPPAERAVVEESEAKPTPKVKKPRKALKRKG